MENNNKYHNGSSVYWYDSYDNLRYGKIYSINEHNGTAEVMRYDDMKVHLGVNVELFKLWPTKQDCIEAKRNELMESVTDVRSLLELMLEHGKWEGLGEVVKDVAEAKMDDLLTPANKTWDHYTGVALDRIDESYKITDIELQNACVGYLYDVDKKSAADMRKGLTEREIAEAYDYFKTRHIIPLEKHRDVYKALCNEREYVEMEYGLSPIDAIQKRDSLSMEERRALTGESFADAVSDIPVSDNKLEQ